MMVNLVILTKREVCLFSSGFFLTEKEGMKLTGKMYSSPKKHLDT